MGPKEKKYDLTPIDSSTNQWEVLPEEMPQIVEGEDSLVEKDLTIAADIELSSESLLKPTSPSETLDKPESAQTETEQTVETENINHYEENFKAIKKQRGESFVKYLRGNMSEFMDQPNFKDEICRIVPNKRRALKTLEDNHEYIRETLQVFYRGEVEEDEGPPPNPYELVKRAGYELSGPFERVEEVEKYYDDFREGEHLCTFNDIGSRLSAYNILWLRHQNYDQILPADELTQENLSQEWKQYLRERSLYDKETGLYDIDNIRPAREDPYGTSSMSVQISKTGSHVSIKNHYNHRVGNPDSTLGNKLDNVVVGLERSIFSKVGRLDLVGSLSANLAESYMMDNNGGIHPFMDERNNIYSGYYERIENGEVETIPEDKYHQIMRDMYIRRGNIAKNMQKAEQKGKDYKPYIGDAHDAKKVEFSNNDDGTRRVTYYKDDGEKFADYDYSIGDDGNVDHAKLRICAETNNLYRWLNLDELSFADFSGETNVYNSDAEKLIIEDSNNNLSDSESDNVIIDGNYRLKYLEIGDNRRARKVVVKQILESMKVGEHTIVEELRVNRASDRAPKDGANIELAKGSSMSQFHYDPTGGSVTFTIPEHSAISITRRNGDSFFVLGDEMNRADNKGANIGIYNTNLAISMNKINIVIKNDDGSERRLRLISDRGATDFEEEFRVVDEEEALEIEAARARAREIENVKNAIQITYRQTIRDRLSAFWQRFRR